MAACYDNDVSEVTAPHVLYVCFLSVLCCIACHGVMGLEPAIENK